MLVDLGQLQKSFVFLFVLLFVGFLLEILYSHLEMLGAVHRHVDVSLLDPHLLELAHNSRHPPTRSMVMHLAIIVSTLSQCVFTFTNSPFVKPHTLHLLLGNSLYQNWSEAAANFAVFLILSNDLLGKNLTGKSQITHSG